MIYHLNHGFIVLENVQHSPTLKKINSRSKAHCQHDTDQKCRAWLEPRFGFVCACLMCVMQQVSCTDRPLALLSCFWEEWNTSTPKFQRSRAGIPSMRKPASREIVSASVEQCDTEVSFVHIQLIGTNM